MCKRWKPRRVPPGHGRHQGEHPFPVSQTRRDDSRGRPGTSGASQGTSGWPAIRRHDRSVSEPGSPGRSTVRRDHRNAVLMPGRFRRVWDVPDSRPRGARPGRGARTDQRPGRDRSGRGRRECGAWSLSRMGRVSRSESAPTGAVQLARPLALPTGSAGRTERTAGLRPAVVGPADRPTFSSEAVAPETAGNRPVSAVRCRPGLPGPTVGAATPCRPGTAAGPAADAASSGARRRPPVEVVSSGARRRPPGTAEAGGSGARRHPPERAGAGTSGARRRPPLCMATGTSGARRRPPAGATVASGTTERSHTTGRLAVDDPESARCSRREEGWRATDSSRSADRTAAGSGAIARWRSGRRRVSSSVQAVSSTPSRTTLTQTWQEPSAVCRQPSSSPDHQAPA